MSNIGTAMTVDPSVEARWRVVPGAKKKLPTSSPTPAARSIQPPSANRPPNSTGRDTDVPPISTLVPAWPMAPGIWVGVVKAPAAVPLVTSGVGCGALLICHQIASALAHKRARPFVSSARASCVNCICWGMDEMATLGVAAPMVALICGVPGKLVLLKTLVPVSNA